MSTIIAQLKCEYQTDPIGMDAVAPRFSWIFQSDLRDIEQTAYQILVADQLELLQKDQGNCWDSGMVNSKESIQQSYRGIPLVSRQRYYWKVRALLKDGETTPWSEPAFWEMGLLNRKDWRATWITPDGKKSGNVLDCPLIRKSFKLDRQTKSARVYITALGLYELWLNGRRVGDQYFTPGWTSYGERLQYQTYDVTALLRRGENVVGVILGDGWYRGRLGWEGWRNIYGDQRALLLQMEVHNAVGEQILLVSDTSWKMAAGPILRSDIYDGEVYDARLEKPGWADYDFNDDDWICLQKATAPAARLIAPVAPPVRVIEVIKPKEIIHSPKGETIFDFGQNMVGCVRLRVSGEAGDVISLHHAESLDAEGNLYTENLRSAQQHVQYILKGEELETYQPRFTFQGFRYVAVEGYPGSPTLDSLRGVVLHSDTTPTGQFTCSDSKINQLHHNIVWSQKGNFLDVPTDCPQRDERLGWTGDAQVFIRTAAFNMDVAGFFTKWLGDLAVDQRSDGSITHVVPDVLPESGSSAWGDAATIVPWVLYQFYGDKRILADQYKSMKHWVDYVHKQAGDNLIWDSGFHFGDWLAGYSTNPLFPPSVTSTDLIATAFFAHSTDLMARTAAVLGKHDEAQKYNVLLNAIKSAFMREFVSLSGRIGANTQAAYVLPLMFDLLPEDQRPTAASRLVNLIRKNDNHLSTGFVSTPYICIVLTRYGYVDVAYELLKQKSPPSWLYAVNKGATTIWEHWDSIKPDDSFQDARMNSFNHYANGSIGEWLYQSVAGIYQVEPGFKRFVIQPRPGGGMTHAKASYQSMYGEIVSSWEIAGEHFKLNISVPPNTKAEVRPPDGSDPIDVGSGQHYFACLYTAE